MQQKIIKTKIYGIGEIEVSICQTGQDWWQNQIEEFVTHNESGFTTIATLNNKFKSQSALQSALQNFINFIQSGGEPQAANKIRNHFNNWLNKTNGIIGTKNGFSTNGSNLSGTTVIRPDKTFEGTF